MKNKKPFVLGALVLLALYILISLGNWQVRRLACKKDLIVKIETRSKLAPTDFYKIQPDCVSPLVSETSEYLPLSLTGHFLHKIERHIYALDKRGRPGWHIYTLFKLSDPDRPSQKCIFEFVFINRGFVPNKIKEAEKRLQGQLEGELTLIGLVRHNPVPAYTFSPTNDPLRNEYFAYKNISELLRNTMSHPEMMPVAPYSIDLKSPTPSGGWPRPGVTRINFPNNHLGYIITWYGLALALLGVYGFFLYGQLTKPVEIKPAPSLKEGQAQQAQEEEL